MTTKQIQRAGGMRPDGRFPDFPPRDGMQNPIHLYDPGYPTAVRRCLGFHEDTPLVVAEVPLGWRHGPRKGILISDLMVAFEVNVAGVIARRGYSILSQPGAGVSAGDRVTQHRPAGRGAEACRVRGIRGAGVLALRPFWR